MIRSISKKKSFLWLLNLRPIAARKVVVHLRATGDAPILKQTKFKIAGTDKFSKVIEFLLHQLRRDTVFVYVNSAFSPGPDEVVNELYDICNNLLHHHHHHSPSTTTKKATSYSKFKKHKITII